jgi:hypothetical protein
LIDVNADAVPELDARGLRRFGLTTGGLFVGLFGLTVPWCAGYRYPLWPWILGAILGGWALIAPKTLRPVYRGWMRVGLLLNRVTTPIILGIVYFLVFMPIALLMRLFGRDSLARRFDRRATSYRVTSVKRPPTHMERPF